MRTFKDSEGLEWQISLNIGSAKRIKDVAGVDIMDLQDGTLFDRMADPETLFNVLWALCEKQAKENNLDDVGFAERLDGDTVEAATDVLLQEIIDFFPKAKRPLLRKMYQKVQELETEQIKGAQGLVNDPEFKKEVSARMKAGH